MTRLVVAPADHAAAVYAVTRWHYSRRMPSGKLVRAGAWEDGEFIGVVMFGRGAAPALGRAFGCSATQVCELVRVALTAHQSPTTQVVASAIAWLRRTNPGLRLIVSFADEGQGHLGTIYQAGNWVYTGAVDHQWYRVRGRLVHPKTLHSTYGVGGQSIPWLREHVDPAAERVSMPPKHRYVMPLDRGMRRVVSAMAVPFPRGQGLEGEPALSQGAGPGSTPGDRSTISPLPRLHSAE
jgi:hypothetical protein